MEQQPIYNQNETLEYVIDFTKPNTESESESDDEECISYEVENENYNKFRKMGYGIAKGIIKNKIREKLNEGFF